MSAWIGLVARLVTGGVWVVAGGIKLQDPSSSVRAVRAYELLPEAIVPAVGYLLPALEVVVGLALILGLFTRWAAVTSAVLFLVFIIGISSAWARGLRIDCGCFGGGGFNAKATDKYPWEIARDAALFAFSGYLVARPRTALSLDNFLSPKNRKDPIHGDPQAQ